MNEEIWRPVVGYEGFYEVSNFGRVRSLSRYVNHSTPGKKKFVKGIDITWKYGRYAFVILYKNGIGKTHLIHRLVAQAFVPNPLNLPEVNHIDENHFNNFYLNLEWIDQHSNKIYGTRVERIAEKNKKPINAYDLQGNFIRRFDSGVKCSLALGISRGNISSVLTGKKESTGGYILKFA